MHHLAKAFSKIFSLKTWFTNGLGLEKYAMIYDTKIEPALHIINAICLLLIKKACTVSPIAL